MIPLPGKTAFIAAAVGGVIAFGTGWTAASWRLDGAHERALSAKDGVIAERDATIATIRQDAADDLAKANEEALARYVALEARKQAAVAAAAEQAQRNAAAADRARTDAERLRQQLAAADRVSTATVSSLRDYTTTLQSVFGACVTELGSMAAAADGHAVDSRALINAWPR